VLYHLICFRLLLHNMMNKSGDLRSMSVKLFNMYTCHWSYCISCIILHNIAFGGRHCIAYDSGFIVDV